VIREENMSRYLFNTEKKELPLWEEDRYRFLKNADMADFHKSLEGYNPTPFVELKKAPEILGTGTIITKDESKRFGIKAFKALGASYAIYRVLKNLWESKFGTEFNHYNFRDKEKLERLGKFTFCAASDGNHGRAVAYMARQLGIDAVICLSTRVPQYRVDAIKRLGAKAEVFGKSQDEAMYHALQLQKDQGLAWIDALDDPFIIAGHGTIGLELLEDLPDIDTAIVPLSGGGLISGIALALKSANSSIQVIGVSPECAPAMYHSLKAGHPVEIEEKDTLADALLGGIGLDNQYTFRMVQKYVDNVILLSEEEIAEGMAFALDKHHLVVEGAGAVGIAALLTRKVKDLRGKVVVVISGGNVSLPLLLKIAQNHSSRGAKFNRS